FSSRRRHTRFSRDWSSDVCSSDLIANRLMDSIMQILKCLIRPDVNMPESIVVLKSNFKTVNSHVFADFCKNRKRLLICLTSQNRSEERRVGKECNTRM